MSRLRQFAYTHRKALAGVGVVAAVATGGVAVAAGGHTGTMAVDQQAVDLFNARVDQPVVDFYDSVCAQVHRVTDIPHQFGQADVDAVGLTGEQRVGVYRRGVTDVHVTLMDVADQLAAIDAHAPQAVRVDGGTEGTDYRGAVSSLRGYVTSQVGHVRELLDLPGISGTSASTDQAVDDAIHTMRTRSAAVPAGISDPLRQVMDSASIFSKATSDAVTHSPQCGDLLDPSKRVPESTVVSEYVAYATGAQSAYTLWSDSLDKLRSVDKANITDPSEAAIRLSQAWSDVANGASGASARIPRATTEDMAPGPVATSVEHLAGLENQVRDSYDRIASWARGAAQRLNDLTQPGRGVTLDQLNDLTRELSGEFTEITREHQKTMARVNNDLQIPNQATADAVKRAGEDQPR